jgi:hypothetical protein
MKKWVFKTLSPLSRKVTVCAKTRGQAEIAAMRILDYRSMRSGVEPPVAWWLVLIYEGETK